VIAISQGVEVDPQLGEHHHLAEERFAELWRGVVHQGQQTVCLLGVWVSRMHEREAMGSEEGALFECGVVSAGFLAGVVAGVSSIAVLQVQECPGHGA
jgi:hypothetical protein